MEDGSALVIQIPERPQDTTNWTFVSEGYILCKLWVRLWTCKGRSVSAFHLIVPSNKLLYVPWSGQSLVKLL